VHDLLAAVGLAVESDVVESTRRSCAGPTGQPGRQLAPSSAAVTG
jgi:hypothetical protein